MKMIFALAGLPVIMLVLSNSHTGWKFGGLLFFDPIQFWYANTGMDPSIIWAACQFFVGNCLYTVKFLDPEKDS